EQATLHPPAIARHDWLQEFTPALRAVHVARPKGASLQVALLVEHKERVVAGALEVPVVRRPFLLAVGLAHAAVHVEHDGCSPAAVAGAIDPLPRQIGKGVPVLLAVIASVSKRPIWLVDAASFQTARPATAQRIAGSRPSRSASFT